MAPSELPHHKVVIKRKTPQCQTNDGEQGQKCIADCQKWAGAVAGQRSFKGGRRGGLHFFALHFEGLPMSAQQFTSKQVKWNAVAARVLLGLGCRLSPAVRIGAADDLSGSKVNVYFLCTQFR